MFHVNSSESTNTGVAPAVTIDCAGEIIVNVGSITSSPGPIPSALRSIYIARK